LSPGLGIGGRGSSIASSEIPPCPFVLVSGTSLIVCPPTSSRARMSRKADAAVSVIWSMTLTPSRRGLCVYPHERLGHLDELYAELPG